MSESQRAALSALCLVTVVAVGILAVGLVGHGMAEEAGVETHQPPASSPLGSVADTNTESIASNTTIHVKVQPNGDAVWTIRERFNLSTTDHHQVFQRLATDFESDDVDGSALGLDGFVAASELVDAETERSMSITGVQRSSAVENDTGELTLTFTWENFARIDEHQLALDDVYETEQGLWFQGLAENQQLIIESPDGYGFSAANVVIQDGRLHWDGPETFTNETLQAIMVGNGGASTPENGDDTPGNGAGNGNGSETPSTTGWLGVILAGLGAVMAVVVIVFFAVDRERLQGVFPASKGDEDDTASHSQGGESQTETEPDDAPDERDLELLSDEERVERLLDQNGGRMKQANIVKETDWSNAKVSQLLSAMEEEGRINKLRIGRENLISFPDEDIADIGDK